MSLDALYAGRNLDPGELKARQRRAAAEAGLPMGDRTMTYNSRLAAELGKWAESRGKGDAYHRAVFQAYYVDGANIARAAVLIALAETAGLSGDEAAEVLRMRAFRAAVDADWELAGQLGITAVPTFLLAGWAVVGAQPYEVLEKLLLDQGVKRRS